MLGDCPALYTMSLALKYWFLETQGAFCLFCLRMVKIGLLESNREMKEKLSKKEI